MQVNYDQRTRTRTIWIDHEYGIGRWGDSVSLFKKCISDTPDALQTNLHINSLGGSMDTGEAISAIVAGLPNTTAYYFGYVASAATIIGMACKKTVAVSNSKVLIHNLQMVVFGDLEIDIIPDIESAKEVNADLVARYVAKTQKTPAEVTAAMNKRNNWMTAAKAKDFGLVDEIIPALPNVFDQKTIDASLNQQEKYMSNNITANNAESKANKQDRKPEQIKSAVANFLSFFGIDNTHQANNQDKTSSIDNETDDHDETTPAKDSTIEQALTTNEPQKQTTEAHTTNIASTQQNVSPPSNSTTMSISKNPLTAINNTVSSQPYTLSVSDIGIKFTKKPEHLNAFEVNALIAMGRQIPSNCACTGGTPTEIDYSEINAALGSIPIEVREDWFRKRKLGDGLYPKWWGLQVNVVANRVYTDVGVKSGLGHIAQARDICDAEPIGEIALGLGPKNIARFFSAKVKACLPKFYEGYLNLLVANGTSPTDHPFVRYLIENLFSAQFILDAAACNYLGVYVPGGGNHLDGWDGLHKLIADHIDTNPLNTSGHSIPSVSLGPANTYVSTSQTATGMSYVDYVLDFVAAVKDLPLGMSNNGSQKIIVCSERFAEQYWQQLIQAYAVLNIVNTAQGLTMPSSTVQIPFTNSYVLWPDKYLGDGDLLIATTQGNIKFATARISDFANTIADRSDAFGNMCIGAAATGGVFVGDYNCGMVVNNETNTYHYDYWEQFCG